jgi:hypothetical protein
LQQIKAVTTALQAINTEGMTTISTIATVDISSAVLVAIYRTASVTADTMGLREHTSEIMVEV